MCNIQDIKHTLVNKAPSLGAAEVQEVLGDWKDARILEVAAGTGAGGLEVGITCRLPLLRVQKNMYIDGRTRGQSSYK